MTESDGAENPSPQRRKDDSKSDDVPPLSDRFRKPPWNEPPRSKVPLGDMTRTFGPHVSPYKGPLLQAFSALFVGALIHSTLPLSTKFVIDFLLPSRNYTLLVLTAVILMVLYLLRTVINILGGHLLMYISSHVVFGIRQRLFHHLQLLHLAFYEKEQSGKLVSKVINDTAALQALLRNALPVLTVNSFLVIVTVILMCTLSLKLTFFATLILPVYFIVSYVFRVRVYRRSKEVRERHSVAAGNINEVITGIKVVKSFAMEDMEQRRFVNMLKENLNYEMDLGNVQILRGNSLEFLTGVGTALTLLVGGAAVMSLDMTTGDYVAFLGFLSMLFMPMLQFSNLTIQVIEARTGLERVYHILNIKPTITDRPNARKVDSLEGHVRIEDVTFAYDAENEPVLKDLNIEAKPGEVVALVGPSGAGKSTIVNLLTRFYDPTQGRVLIDGADLRNLQSKSYRNRIGIVLQEPFLFSGTIMDNICYGGGRASPEAVEEAARRANAMEFIEHFDEGMQSQVGERGGMLSGGQRQRIAIARAFLKDPDILILDEATSALDTRSERLVQEALERLLQGRTVFIVAHRLTTIKNADKIVVMDKGRVVEEGTHDMLLKNGGLYSTLYEESQKVSDSEISVTD